MKSQLAIALTVLLYSASPVSSGTRLSGCPDPDTIVNALAELQQNDWNQLSSQRLRSMWPTNLNSLSCESADGCRMLGSKGRIIEGVCQCCEMFAFSLEPNAPDNDQLDSVVIQYSATSRPAVVTVAKRLARAAGLSGVQVATVGKEAVQKFEWESQRGLVNATFNMDIQFTRVGKIWHVYLSLASQEVGH